MEEEESHNIERVVVATAKYAAELIAKGGTDALASSDELVSALKNCELFSEMPDLKSDGQNIGGCPNDYITQLLNAMQFVAPALESQFRVTVHTKTSCNVCRHTSATETANLPWLSLQVLAPIVAAIGSASVEMLLTLFTTAEPTSGWYCTRCKKTVNASRTTKFVEDGLPATLLLQLPRTRFDPVTCEAAPIIADIQVDKRITLPETKVEYEAIATVMHSPGHWHASGVILQSDDKEQVMGYNSGIVKPRITLSDRARVSLVVYRRMAAQNPSAQTLEQSQTQSLSPTTARSNPTSGRAQMPVVSGSASSELNTGSASTQHHHQIADSLPVKNGELANSGTRRVLPLATGSATSPAESTPMQIDSSEAAPRNATNASPRRTAAAQSGDSPVRPPQPIASAAYTPKQVGASQWHCELCGAMFNGGPAQVAQHVLGRQHVKKATDTGSILPAPPLPLRHKPAQSPQTLEISAPSKKADTQSLFDALTVVGSQAGNAVDLASDANKKCNLLQTEVKRMQRKLETLEELVQDQALVIANLQETITELKKTARTRKRRADGALADTERQAKQARTTSQSVESATSQQKTADDEDVQMTQRTDSEPSTMRTRSSSRRGSLVRSDTASTVVLPESQEDGENDPGNGKNAKPKPNTKRG